MQFIPEHLGLPARDPGALWAAVKEDLQKITRLGADRGLQVNLGKCVLWTPASRETVACQQALSRVHQPKYIPSEGIRVLGAPVVYPEGAGAYSRSLCQKSLGQMREICRVLTHLPAAHMQPKLRLLRFHQGCACATLNADMAR